MFEEIRDAIAEKLDIDIEKISMDSKLVDDLKADSLDMIDLITDFEEKYELEISNEDLQTLVTVGDIVKYLEDHR